MKSPDEKLAGRVTNAERAAQKTARTAREITRELVARYPVVTERLRQAEAREARTGVINAGMVEVDASSPDQTAAK
ncbi:MAG: hypothetical protein BGN83_19800 [Rhizobium sp. 63-7]|nr:MAG: hypothetical protein BGN83_19800 [Rhizobium sp. 63-7]